MFRITTTIRASSLIVPLMLCQPAAAKDLGTFGAVYPVREPDALMEMKAKAAKADWGKYLDREKLSGKIREYRPKDLVSLPAARHDRVFLADMTYTLDRDIPDGKGGILYAKGYTFNPLDYVFFKRVLVIIDGNDKRQVEWFIRSAWRKDMNAMLLITGGSWFKIGERLKRPVFYADRLLVTKLGLRFVPAVAVQKGRFLEVREYEVR
jgi:conjugal transfer pilus assembly protein TraW